MLAIKLKRIGKKHQGSFRIIVSEKRTKLNGRSIDDLGWFNPHDNSLDINKEKVEHWLKSGAKPTDTVNNLLVKAGAITGKKIPVHKKAKVKEGEAANAPEMSKSVAEAPAVPVEEVPKGDA